MRTSEIKGQRSWGNRRPALVIAWLLLVGTIVIGAHPTPHLKDSVKKRTITRAASKDPCQDLEQKLSALKSQRDQLNAKIKAAQGQLTTANKVQAFHDLKEYNEQLQQVEKDIETTQRALDQCQAQSPTPGPASPPIASSPLFSDPCDRPPLITTKCPEGEIWPSPSPSATIWPDKATSLRHIEANGIPNHCVEDDFYHSAIAPQHYHFKVPLDPEPPKAKGSPTPVTVCSKPPQRFGVALNGVPFDPEAVAIWLEQENTCPGGKKDTYTDCIDNVPVSDEELKNHCSTVRWQLDAAIDATTADTYMCCSGAELDMDDHIAHTQKGGLYHYHKLTAQTAAAIAGVDSRCLSKRMTLVGWAFDGFPVYWKYGQLKKGGDVITMQSGWTASENVRRQATKAGGAPVPDNFKKYPAGTFVNDYEYTQGKGDTALDECNGKECYSPDLDKITYCYFITEKFPYIPRCFRGTPNEK
jgi:hypothetical protein